MTYEDKTKWEDDLMEDDSLMEDDDDSFDRYSDDRRTSQSDFLRNLPRPPRHQKGGIWTEPLDDKGDFNMKAIEKIIVHKNFFNSFDDDFDDEDLK